MASALERAARAQYEAWIEDVRDLEPSWDDLPDSHRFRLVESCRTVLMAVAPTLKRYDSDQAGPYEDERGDYVLFADLDAILNEKDTTND